MLRLLLAVSVVLTHTDAPYVLAGGRIAVQLFYMISGFLISYVIHKDAAYASPGRFYLARALRIYPTYYVVALVVLGLFVLEKDRLHQFALLPLSWRVFLGTVNLTLFGQDWTNFVNTPAGALPPHKFLLVPQAWTLGVELSFYVVAPFIIRRRWLLLTLLAASLAARAIAWRLGYSADPWSYRFFPFELALFIAGALSHQLVLPRAESAAPIWRPLFTALTVLVAASATALPLVEPFKTALICLVVFGTLPFLFLFQRTHRWDVALGELSYPIYLVHWAVAMVVLEAAGRFGVARPAALTPIVLLGAFVSAIALDRLVGRPVDRWRARLKARP